MLKKTFMIPIGLFLLIGLMGVNGVAPHPDYLEEMIIKGEGPMLIQKMELMEEMGKDAPVKTFPSTGSRNVLVILIGFKGSSSSYNIEQKENPLKYAAFGIFSIIILGLIITTILGRKKGITGIIIPILLIFIFFPSLTMFNSCFLFETEEPSVTNDDSALSFDSVSTTSFYNTLLDGPRNYSGNSDLSMYKYYYDMSNTQLSLNFTVVGPYTSQYSYSYYGENSGGNDSKPGTLVGEAVDAAEAAGVDFSTYAYGGAVSVLVIHAGRGEETGAGSDYIWSHRWTLNSAQAYGDGSGARSYDGVTINDYSLQSEYVYNPGDTGIGLYCHEFGHVLGLPDLYDTSNVTDGLGKWSLMASGSWNGPGNVGDIPAPLTAWERNYLGWITVSTVTSGTKTITDIHDATPIALKIDSGYSYTYSSTAYDQYYLVENIYNGAGTTWVDYLPGDGLFISLIDNYILNGIPITGGPGTITGNKVNGLTSSGPAAWCHGVTVMEKDSDYELWTAGGLKGNAADLFYSYTGPYSLYRNNFDGDLSGSPLSNDSGIDISNVSAKGSSMTFDF